MKTSLNSSLYRIIDLQTIAAAEDSWKRGIIPIFGIVTATSFIAWALVFAGFPSPEGLSILFVIPVLFSAIFYGLAASLMAAFFSVLAYNFVLLSPVWHIGLFEAENFTKMAVLSLVAVIASALTARIRKMAREALQRERVLSGVYALSQDMLGISNVADMRLAAEIKLASLLATEVHIILKEEKERGNDTLRFCLAHNTPVGNGTKHFSHEKALYLPLSSHSGDIGVMVVSDPLSNQQFSSKILATLAAQTASALEKATFSEAHEKNLLNAERDKFLSALLSSVSHDFKTPLVTVIGALSSLKDMPAIKDNYDCREMVAGGLEEAQKLNRFINNLVEISRLESGLEAIRKDAVLLRDMLASSLKSLHPLIGKQRFSIHAAPNFPLLYVNSALMELVFLNLLENSIKYGAPEGEVKIIASFNEKSATIDIDDDGEGIPESEREAIFVKFYRSKHGDRKIAGTGLGLYICRGIIEAHGGTITAIDPHDGKGACVRLTLPKETLIPIDIEEEMEEV
jgi:two-component system, OmpR family, sensor histidine kinase KdpD